MLPRDRVRGVMLGITRNISWDLDNVVLDKEGRYVLLQGKLNAIRIRIIGAYAPNKIQTPFWGRDFIVNSRMVFRAPD